MKIIWTEQAVEKLEGYADFIALDKAEAALKWAERIYGLVENLQKFPKLGREVPELRRLDIREIIDGEYRIIYRLEAGVISVLTIFHSKQVLRKSDIFSKKTKRKK